MTLHCIFGYNIKKSYLKPFGQLNKFAVVNIKSCIRHVGPKFKMTVVTIYSKNQ